MEYVAAFFEALLTQIIGVLGIFFVLGYILLKLQDRTHKNYVQSVGWKGILFTAWIGTPIHELGHAFFAVLFGHKIHKITLFSPNKETGGLGSVAHSYNKKSIIQNIGNFFIGAAPMIFGSIILFLLYIFLVPSGVEALDFDYSGEQGLVALILSIGQTFISIFTLENLTSWTFWIFIYLAMAISSHIGPSKADRSGMFRGLGWIVLILALVNMVTLSFGVNITSYVLSVNQYLGILSAIFIFTILLSVIHLLFSYILVRLSKKRVS